MKILFVFVFLELISNEVLTDLSFLYVSYSHIWTLNNIPVWKSTELPSDLVAETPYAKLTYCKIHLSQTELCSYSGGEMGRTTQKCGHSSNKAFQQTLHSWQKHT